MSDTNNKKTSILRSSLTLFIITALAALLLAVVYTKTKPVIENTEEKKKIFSYAVIFPDSSFGEEKNTGGQTFVEVHDKDKKLKGYIIFAEGKGYSSTIKIAYGIGIDSKLTDIKIISQQETPGLGARCEEVSADETIISILKNYIKKIRIKEKQIKEPWFQQQYTGLKKDQLWLKKQKSTGKIESITGATITSNAITEAVRKSLKKFLDTHEK